MFTHTARRIRTTAALALAASAVFVSSASADPLAGSKGTWVSPAVPGVADVTLKLGPAGEKQLTGIRDLKVSLAWDNGVASLAPYLGTACTIDRGVVMSAASHLDMRVLYSYIQDNPAPQADTAVSNTIQLVKQTVDSESWDFGVCFDDPN